MDLFKEILDTKTSSSSPRFRMQMADLATAVVKENWDKEHPGCVKVEYILGADGAKTSDWSGSSRICRKRIRLLRSAGDRQ